MGLVGVIYGGYKGAKAIKKHFNLNDIVDAITETSLNITRNGTRVGSINHFSEEQLETANFNTYITTTGWMAEAGVNVYDDPYAGMMFGKVTEKNDGRIMIKERPVVQDIFKKVYKKTGNRPAGIYVLDIDSKNGLDSNYLIRDLNSMNVFHMPTINPEYEKKKFNGYAFEIIGEPQVNLVNTSVLEGMQNKNDFLMYLTDLITKTKEVYSLDNKNPINALKLYSEKQS